LQCAKFLPVLWMLEVYSEFGAAQQNCSTQTETYRLTARRKEQARRSRGDRINVCKDFFVATVREFAQRLRIVRGPRRVRSARSFAIEIGFAMNSGTVYSLASNVT
jgi:hypothetical protein